MNIYKTNDIISYDFLKISKSLFAIPKYKSLSSDAKLSYTFYIAIVKEQYSKTMVNFSVKHYTLSKFFPYVILFSAFSLQELFLHKSYTKYLKNFYHYLRFNITMKVNFQRGFVSVEMRYFSTFMYI